MSDESTPPAQENLGKLLYAVRLAMIKQLDNLIAANHWDINFTQLRVISHLGRNTQVSPSALAQAIEQNGGALTRVLDKLVEKGLVARQPNPNDRRAVDISLSPSGKALWAQMSSQFEEANKAMLSVLEEQEQQQLFELLRRVRNHLDASQ